MLDTVRLGIPLSPKQFDRIWNLVFTSPNAQFGILYPETGELILRRVTGLADTDQNSFHREIRWEIPYTYRSNSTYLTVELSLPKLYYGHNIRLLYNFVDGLKLLKALLEKHFGLKGKGRLVDVYEWQLWRVDCCYAWDCLHSQAIAQQVLDSIKHLHFPRKKPIIYPTTVLFAGTTYSLKFYLKLPEFIHHDRKALLKAKASLEWVNYCEELATGVLRVEATLRRKFLKKRGIETVADLLRPVIEYEFDPSTCPEGYDVESAMFAISCYHTDINEEGADWSVIEWEAEDGQYFDAPEGCELDIYTDDGVVTYRHTGEGFTLRKRDQPTAILQFLLNKFLGENRGMQHIDEVEAKLNATFKPVKAARLMSMWLYVQKFGTQKAKEAFGHNSYYVARRDMKKAEVSLSEPPKNVVRLDQQFWRKFEIRVPSEYVVNRVDDFRDGGNVLNLPSVVPDIQ